MKRALTILCASISILCGSLVLSAPYIDPRDDPQHFGDLERPFFWTPEQKVSGFRNAYRLYPTRRIHSGKYSLPLPSRPQELGDLAIDSGKGTISLNEFIEQRDVAGLLVIKDGEIAFERYALGNDKDTLWLSWSIAKSLTSLLIGAAIKDRYITSLDDKVTDYLPRLKESAYEHVSLKNLMQMSSGVEWNEDYADPNSDINRIEWPTLSALDYLRQLPVAAPPGERFQYNTAETNLAGDVLRAAIGNDLASYASEKIWRPFGMSSDAYWQLKEHNGDEFGGSSFNATLRDYGRLGLFVLAEGQLSDGSRVLPADWIEESTRPADTYSGYGYFWWLLSSGQFIASGIYGQAIFIDPREQAVIALHSARPVANSDHYHKERYEMFKAIVHALATRKSGHNET